MGEAHTSIIRHSRFAIHLIARVTLSSTDIKKCMTTLIIRATIQPIPKFLQSPSLTSTLYEWHHAQHGERDRRVVLQKSWYFCIDICKGLTVIFIVIPGHCEISLDTALHNGYNEIEGMSLRSNPPLKAGLRLEW